MAANTVPERVAWAVEMLDIAPDDRLLEIGCGAGQAVSLICAQNVNVFERRPAQALGVVRSLLLPSGGLYLFFQPPRADKTPRIAERVAARLQLNRFVVSKVETADFQPAPAVCLLAHPSQ